MTIMPVIKNIFNKQEQQLDTHTYPWVNQMNRATKQNGFFFNNDNERLDGWKAQTKTMQIGKRGYRVLKQTIDLLLEKHMPDVGLILVI